jgi:hypothetical protein
MQASKYAWAMLLAVLIAAGCATTSSLVSQQPDWWDTARQHDHEYLFFKALGESSVSMEDARQKAMRSVQQQVTEYVLAEVKTSGETGASVSDVESLVQLSEVTAQGHPHDAKIGSKWYVWVLGRYPVPEYQEIRRRVALGNELNRQWIEASSLVNQRMYEAAEPALMKIIEDYSGALRPPFAVEEVKLALASAYMNQSKNLRAHVWAQDVRRQSKSPEWRQKAAELILKIPPIAVSDAFEDKVVSVVCYQSRKDAYFPNDDLLKLLNNRLAGAGVRTAKVNAVIPDSLNLIDERVVAEISTSLRTDGIDALIVVKLTVDDEKTGQKTEVFGTTKEVLDSKLNYWIVRTCDGAVLASDQTSGYSRKVDAMLHVMTSHRRHLPQYASAIAEKIDCD